MRILLNRGLLVTFEGIEGCGKSTQLRLAAEWLEQEGLLFHCTREPGGTRIGAEIRKILLSQNTVALAPLAETLLYLSDRLQHVAEVIQPQLLRRAIVLCDRYHDSTVAYQGYARGISLELIEKIWRGSSLAIDPDLTLLFDLEPEQGISRSLQKLRAQHLDESRFEEEALEFHAKVRNGFLTLAKKYPERIRTIDASRSMEEVHQDVRRQLEKFLQS
jgi:dTMP kinase